MKGVAYEVKLIADSKIIGETQKKHTQKQLLLVSDNSPYERENTLLGPTKMEGVEGLLTSHTFAIPNKV